MPLSSDEYTQWVAFVNQEAKAAERAQKRQRAQGKRATPARRARRR